MSRYEKRISINRTLKFPEDMGNEESKLYARAIVKERELLLVLAQITALENKKRLT